MLVYHLCILLLKVTIKLFLPTFFLVLFKEQKFVKEFNLSMNILNLFIFFMFGAFYILFKNLSQGNETLLLFYILESLLFGHSHWGPQFIWN
jgi:hypothetical protein